MNFTEFLCRVGFCWRLRKTWPTSESSGKWSATTRGESHRKDRQVIRRSFQRLFKLVLTFSEQNLSTWQDEKNLHSNAAWVVKRSWSCSCVGECNCNEQNFSFHFMLHLLTWKYESSWNFLPGKRFHLNRIVLLDVAFDEDLVQIFWLWDLNNSVTDMSHFFGQHYQQFCSVVNPTFWILITNIFTEDVLLNL